MSSSSLVLKRSSLLNNMFQQQDYFPKVQPRSSSERDNSQLLHTALKAASTDIAHRLLDYASLDKLDCEASCILIALSNNESFHDSKPKEKEEIVAIQKKDNVVKEDPQIIPPKPIIVEKVSTTVTPPQQPQPPQQKQKNDPIMLLMAAAKVVDASDNKIEKRKRSSLSNNARRMDDYPNGRYYRKVDDNKRIRTSPPTPAPTHHKDHRSTRDQSDISMDTNSFSRQYHSMKQNPKVKQNALHTYITYMIYNDLVHGRKQKEQPQTTAPPSLSLPINNNKYTSPIYNNNNSNSTPNYSRSDYYNGNNNDHKPSLSSSSSSATTANTTTTTTDWYNNNSNNRPNIHDDRSIIARPLTAFLWNNNNENASVSSLDKKDVMILPPLASMNTTTRQLSNTFDRLPPV